MRWKMLIPIPAVLLIFAIYFFVVNDSHETRTSFLYQDQLVDQPALGSDSSKIAIIEFADFKCSHCRFMHEQVLPNLKKDYIDTGKVKLFFINFPVVGPDSMTASIAGECVKRQEENLFWDYADAIFEAQESEAENWAKADFLKSIMGTKLDRIDLEDLQVCIDEQQTRPSVMEDIEFGESLEVRGAPTLLINDQRYEGVIRYPRLENILAEISAEESP